jgi:hypothetical protein
MPFVSFDIEIANEVPENDRDWPRLRPGIACVALVREDDDCATVVFDPLADPNMHDPARKAMTTDAAASVVTMLQDAVKRGDTIVTWNGVGFDFPVLAVESGRFADCIELALGSVDMMFQLFCDKGYPLALDTALAGMGLQSKTHSVTLRDGTVVPISGADAPGLWQAGEHAAVMKYCGDDVKRTVALAVECQKRRRLTWRSRRGNPMELHVGSSWLTVRQCLLLPLPDTSWMTNPLPRERFIDWMGPAAAV